jgi:hypothetical protein
MCADLINGTAVEVGGKGELFQLESVDARSVLAWYVKNPGKWLSHVFLTDAEALVKAVVSPALPASGARSAIGRTERRIYKLQSAIIHRFAGIHAYGTAAQAPKDLTVEFKEPVTLFEGGNGSGKTSIVNAIAWCLTGMLVRPQRPPEAANAEFLMRCERDEGEAEAATEHSISFVTPLPSPATYKPGISEKSLPIDTWVELTLIDDSGNTKVIRREQTRVKGRLVETAPDLSALGLDPVAYRISTVMPAMIPYIRLGDTSELGAAVAKLTGLGELVNLARHANRTSERLTTDFRKVLTTDIEKSTGQYREARNDLVTRLDEFPAIKPSASIPLATEAGVLEKVQGLSEHFEQLKAEWLASVRDILGSRFDPTVAEDRRDIEANIAPAMAQLSQLGKLPNAERLKTLSKLAEEDLMAAEALLEDILTQARTVAALAVEPKSARRHQLYARIAAWIRGDSNTEGPNLALRECVVCGESLVDKTDPETGKLISLHVHAALEEGTDFIGLTTEEWMLAVQGRLTTGLPEALRRELADDLPRHPKDLIRSLIGNDLFEAICFKGKLNSLKSSAADLCDAALSSLDDTLSLVEDAWPESLKAPASELIRDIARLRRAIAFARWRREHEKAVVAAFVQIVGRPSGQAPAQTQKAAEYKASTLTSQLEAIQKAVDGVAPITAALSLCQRMKKALESINATEQRIKDYERTATALLSIGRLGTLAEQQVDGLRARLEGTTSAWLKKIYQKTQSAGHDLVGLDVTPKGALGVALGGGGVSGPAEHIANASALRATLVAFFLAFWEHVLRERGGMNFLLLDDPQELLDEENMQRFAEAFPAMVRNGTQFAITTHDREFAKYVVNEMVRVGIPADHRAVSPVNSERHTLQLPLSIDGLARKRKAFELPENKDLPVTAQEYAAEVRVFVEAKLADLFDDPAYAVTQTRDPSLSDHLNRVRSKVTECSPFFVTPAVRQLSEHPAFSQNSKALKLLNQSHHPQRQKITYMQVQEVAQDLRTMCEFAVSVHEEFRRWRKRESGQALAAKVLPFKPLSPPPIEVKKIGKLAAFAGSAGSSVGGDEESVFAGEWFADKALMRLNTHNLGFSAPINSIVIVEMKPTEAADKSLVVALHADKVLARRLLRSDNDRVNLTLAAETADPRQRPPTRLVQAAAVTTYRVVGVLLDRNYPAVVGSKQEAVEIDGAAELRKIEVAFGVKDDSALPLALPGQTVIGGASIAPAEYDRHRGQLIALALSDGTQLLKRISHALPGELSHVRQFESIGGYGDSFLAATEHVEGRTDEFPLIWAARLVIGVLYE